MTALDRLSFRIALLEIFAAKSLYDPLKDEFNMIHFIFNTAKKLGMPDEEAKDFVNTLRELSVEMAQEDARDRAKNLDAISRKETASR